MIWEEKNILQLMVSYKVNFFWIFWQMVYSHKNKLVNVSLKCCEISLNLYFSINANNKIENNQVY